MFYPNPSARSSSVLDDVWYEVVTFDRKPIIFTDKRKANAHAKAIGAIVKEIK